MGKGYDAESCGNPGDFSLSLSRAFHGVETLCEPFFDPCSLILAGPDPGVKVRVLNDVSGGLVRLFEMYRINAATLAGILDIHRESTDPTPPLDNTRRGHLTFRPPGCIKDYLDVSPFLGSEGDIDAGLRAFLIITRAVGRIDREQFTGDAISSTISGVHATLEGVLVENLPFTGFMKRFDRLYTVFFIPASKITSFVETPGIHDLIPTLAGRLLFNAGPEHLEIIEGGFGGRLITRAIHVDFNFPPFKEYFLML
ncbi:MAG: hypothetical protein ACTSUE_23235 [Promethearchaeota archaeon]